MLLPRRCAACRRPGPSLCPSCAADLTPAPPAPVPVGLATCASLVAYESRGRDLVTGLKFRNARGVVRPLAGPLALLAEASFGVAASRAVVTWAPTTGARRRARGFDQAELLARAVARELRLPCQGLLRRTGPAQTGRRRDERLEGPTFRARGSAARTLAGGRAVVLVDDVTTTGATLRAAAGALHRAGAGEVHGLTLAATPSRPLRHPTPAARSSRAETRA